MKKLLIPILLFAIYTIPAEAQLREDLASPFDYSGQIVNYSSPPVQTGLDRFFNSIKMSHSYTMSFSSFGGSYQNVNAYTNTMEFSLSPRMNGRVDISFLHSPFGGNSSYMGQNSFQNRVVIQNAELNYQISDKAFIRVSYQQLPYGYGYNPFNRYGAGYSRYNRYNPFGTWY